MYARGMSTRDIRDRLKEIYGVTVSPDLISTVTDGITDELKAWHNRPLDPVDLVVYLDAGTSTPCCSAMLGRAWGP